MADRPAKYQRGYHAHFRSHDDVIAEMDELSTMGLLGLGQADGSVVLPSRAWSSGSWSESALYQARLTAWVYAFTICWASPACHTTSVTPS
jgi:hypothetical protein